MQLAGFGVEDRAKKNTKRETEGRGGRRGSDCMVGYLRERIIVSME